jgi:GNAT superfamily N-acetyltransferase
MTADGTAPLSVPSPAPAHAPARVTVREASLADLPTVAELRLALLREAADHPVYGRLRADADERAPEMFAIQLASASEATFLAERAGRVIGILRCVETHGSPLLHPPRYCYVSSVYVRPEHRRSGALRALFARAGAWCRGRGLHEMRLHNIPGGVAAAAWDALGFEVVEQVRHLRLD